jgi:hypothetical protein
MGSCSVHYIREEVLKGLALTHLQRVLRYVQQFEEAFFRQLFEQSFENRRV